MFQHYNSQRLKIELINALFHYKAIFVFCSQGMNVECQARVQAPSKDLHRTTKNPGSQHTNLIAVVCLINLLA